MKLDKPYAFKDAYERICDATNVRTQTEVAKLLDIKQSSISDAKGKNTIPDGWLLKLYRRFRLEPDFILYGLGPRSLHDMTSGVAEGFAGYAEKAPEAIVYAMSASDPADGSWKRLPKGKIPLPGSCVREKLLVVQMDNKSMDPVIKQDAHVGIDPLDVIIKSGEIYALAVTGEGLIVKRIHRDLEKRQLVLLSENPSYQPQNIPIDSPDYVVIGKTIWVIQEL